ncbi:MAG: hydantoinase B/oxoprolinase family protein, partial [Solirubrobacteraceae bacterium]
VWVALASAITDRAVAPTCADANWFVASATDPDTDEVHVLTDLPAGGWGGTPFDDGMHVTMDPLGNCQNLPAETAEAAFPVRYLSYEIATDSAGDGEHRGGCGVRLEIQFLGRGQIITMESSRTRAGSPGINGGGASARQRQLRRAVDGGISTIGGLDEDGTWLPQMLGNVAFMPGESFIFESTGGGGWGSPIRRSPERVANDVRNGFVSREKALDTYGVVLTDDDAADVDETQARRRTMIDE